MSDFRGPTINAAKKKTMWSRETEMLGECLSTTNCTYNCKIDVDLLEVAVKD